MSALLMFMLFLIILMNKTGGQFQSRRQTGQSNRRTLVAAAPVTILQNTLSFLCIMLNSYI